MQALVKAFDSNGSINVDAFMAAMRPPLSGRRLAIVNTAWDRIDVNGAKSVSIERLSECYDVSRNNDFIEGTQT